MNNNRNRILIALGVAIITLIAGGAAIAINTWNASAVNKPGQLLTNSEWKEVLTFREAYEDHEYELQKLNAQRNGMIERICRARGIDPFQCLVDPGTRLVTRRPTQPAGTPRPGDPPAVTTPPTSR